MKVNAQACQTTTFRPLVAALRARETSERRQGEMLCVWKGGEEGQAEAGRRAGR